MHLNTYFYSFQGFLRPFLIGYVAYSGIRCFAMWQKIVKNPSLLFNLLTEKRTLNLGLFLGGFGGTFRVSIIIISKLKIIVNFYVQSYLFISFIHKKYIGFHFFLIKRLNACSLFPFNFNQF